ncbi:NAC domain-containing protein 78-like [Rutidosis leptorrhynchoides]|uniref:NAC domain-containing protein 78-like n=1 Tax=Rutidosis leptorrhynchoides TaxID=125765 RepID=UPI003A99D830
MASLIDPTPAPTSLAPGFRFHPTDEELVQYYLRRKVCGKPFRFDAIADVDVYKFEPWDLPGLSRLRSRDLEWYFFSVLGKKSKHGSRPNRATEKGYWKTTGKVRVVCYRSQQIGMKKILVYHSGRAPKGEKTNWVMHEYRLIDHELQNSGVVQNTFVLCRICQKCGSGPMNGEKYGAPFIDEEWEDDETVFVPEHEVCAKELPIDMDFCSDPFDVEQNFYSAVEDGPLPPSIVCSINMNPADISTIVTSDPLNYLVGPSECEPQVNQNDGSTSLDLPVQTGLDTESVNCVFMEEPSNNMNFDVDCLFDEPYYDATGDFSLDESLSFQAGNLKNVVETDSGLDILDEYTSLLNPDFDNYFDPVGTENTLPDSSVPRENVNGGTHQLTNTSQPFERQNDNLAAANRGNQDQKTDTAHSYLKKASYMLGNISAPPAFASEFPTKYIDSAFQASNLLNVTSSMIRTGNVSFNGGAVDLSLRKHTQLNIVLSFGLGQQEVSYATSHQVVKPNPMGSRSWFYCVFVSILVLSLSFKIGSLVCSRSFMS